MEESNGAFSSCDSHIHCTFHINGLATFVVYGVQMAKDHPGKSVGGSGRKRKLKIGVDSLYSLSKTLSVVLAKYVINPFK